MALEIGKHAVNLRLFRRKRSEVLSSPRIVIGEKAPSLPKRRIEQHCRYHYRGYHPTRSVKQPPDGCQADSAEKYQEDVNSTDRPVNLQVRHDPQEPECRTPERPAEVNKNP